jgi:acyl-CoA synthetase (AMP-forming)/AMP-acid ligase II/acetyltransferase-like isoleucine patch superfamily enzyme
MNDGGTIFSPDNRKGYGQPNATTLYQLLNQRADAAPEAPAILAPQRRPLTYSGLGRQVRQTVGALRGFGLQRNDRVAVVLPNGPEMAVSFLAITAGVTCAPLNPAYRLNEFDFYLSDLNAKALILPQEMKSPAREAAEKRGLPVIELRPDLTAEAGIFELSGKLDAPLADDHDFATSEDIALVLHTSGTTSRPKIVPLTQANVCTSAHNIARSFDLTAQDRCLNVMPLFHIHGLIGALLSSLAAGASVVCSPGFDADRFFEWVEAFEPTWFTAVPTMHQAILTRAAANERIINRRALRFIRSCSAALPENVMADLEAKFGVPVLESYGMTEAAHQMTSNPPPPAPRKPGSVGVAAGPDVAIMDASGTLLSPGEPGEVVIRGSNVTAGYENNPAANESAFTRGWFRTGDQGRFDTDGYLFITGRIKEIINRGGEKIAPREVDDVLIQHPAVAQAVAFAIPHVTLGEDIGAAVVLRKGAQATETELRDFAAARLADFKVPSRVVIVDEIPKGPTGKLQRIGLAGTLASRLKTDFVAASSSVETELSELWKKVLKVERVGVRDNFFSLGADSLIAATMLTQAQAQFKKAVSIEDFLRSPTIECMAALLQGKAPPIAASQASVKRSAGRFFLIGLKNRFLQWGALYAPGYKSTRVWMHRMRGVAIGTNVSIGTSALIETEYPELVSIGNNVTVGIRAVIIGHLRGLTASARARNERTVRIEDDVYIGPGVIVLPNVTVGRGSVIAAGSVVAVSVPPGVLARGNPARPVAYCGVSLGGGASYEEFLRQLKPIST